MGSDKYRGSGRGDGRKNKTMSDNITHIDDNLALTCDCGCPDFVLLRSGRVECSECQEEVRGGRWHYVYKEESWEAEE